MNKKELETRRQEVIDGINRELSKMDNPQTLEERRASLDIAFQLLEELKNLDEQLNNEQ